MNILVRNCDRQPVGSSACGYYAAACAVAICQGNDPTLWRYDVDQLISFVRSGIKLQHFEKLAPREVVKCKANLRVYNERKKHCVCRMPSIGLMVQYVACNNWFHQQCVTVSHHQLQRGSAEWLGPCCEHKVKGAWQLS
jgi:hypothetical protein